MSRLPSIFISHGSPMMSFMPTWEANRFLSMPTNWPRPRAILSVSAHWETVEPQITSALLPPTMHDYGSGFPLRELYTIKYPAAGDPELAASIQALLAKAGLHARLHPTRGLDHGSWAPLRLTYPAADVPVVQLSIQPHLGPAYHLALGRALSPLRDDGVLIYASGTLVHNLHDLDRTGLKPTPEWAKGFSDWVFARLAQRDDPALIDYREQAPSGAYCHPTDEHLIPFYVALGAATDGVPPRRLHTSFTYSTQCMDCYAFD